MELSIYSILLLLLLLSFCSAYPYWQCLLTPTSAF
jgi:hypothetical protein